MGAALARRPRIALVEDDADSAEAMALLLDLHGYDTVWLPTGADAVRRLGGSSPEMTVDAILLDLRLPDMTGEQLGRQLLGCMDRVPPLIIVSAGADTALQAAGTTLHATAVLRKPFGTDHLLAVLQSAAGGGTA